MTVVGTVQARSVVGVLVANETVYRSLGPFPGGTLLEGVRVVASADGATTLGVGLGISGGSDETVENFQASRLLFTRGDVVVGVGLLTTFFVAANDRLLVGIPVGVVLEAGATWVICALRSSSVTATASFNVFGVPVVGPGFPVPVRQVS